METEPEKQGGREKTLKENYERQIELNRSIEALKKETYDKIKNNPEVLEFLAPYNSFMYESFFESYSTRKAMWYVFKEDYKEEQEKKASRFLEIARAGFECLQKRKMYDLRREWGAGLIDLPDMKTPFDFMEKCIDVFALDWIPPISPEEVDILRDFIKQSTSGNLDFLLPYEAKEFSIPFILSEGETIGLPHSFSVYYHTRTNPSIHILPDKRGKKAQSYLLEYKKVEKQELDEKIARGEIKPPKELDLRPLVPTDKPWFLEAFIKKFDTKETWYNYQIYKGQTNPLHEEEDQDEEASIFTSVKDRIETVMHKLEDLDVILPVKANADWRVALIEAYNEYEREAILHAIDQVYEEYRFHVESGIQFLSRDTQPFNYKTISQTKELVQKGWELMGETGEMDFR